MNVPGWTGTEPTSEELDRAVSVRIPEPAEVPALLDFMLAGIKPDRVRLRIKRRRAGGEKIRAGYTKNHGKGQSKTRRLMAKASRRRNRVR